eukprot:TRINITY_DN6959_c0_g1_i1.p1 TRINITY_DN6959_c0_g1~~TRINITY_DN6959_c0_g1_i1.p1  ORF type:complete len:1873 (-),score=329.46 TRINITY_DN6959_c0_g1_i1:121-5739(-)
MENNQNSKTSLSERLSKFLSGTQNNQVKQPKKWPEKKIGPELSSLLKSVHKSLLTDQRILAIAKLNEYISTKALGTDELWQCWEAVNDLASVNDHSSQKAAFSVIEKIAYHHYTNLHSLRHEFFHAIQFYHQTYTALDALKELTFKGRDISPFESELWSILLDWLKKPNHALLSYIVDVLKGNFALIEEHNLVALIKRISAISGEIKPSEGDLIADECLNIVDVILRYGHLPSSCIISFVSTLCRIVYRSSHSQKSWHILENVLQGHSSWHTIKALCGILNDPSNKPDTALLRGAVFFIGNSVWGSKRITTLNLTTIAVLPYLLHVLSFADSDVADEVAAGLKRLVSKYYFNLRVEWSYVFKILEKLYSLVQLSETIDQILVIFEEKFEKEKFNFYGDEKELFGVLELYAKLRKPEHSFFILKHKYLEIQPTDTGWQNNIHHMMSVFFIKETRTDIRVKVLETALQLFDKFKHFYAQEIAEVTFLLFLPSIHIDNDEATRIKGLECVFRVAVDLSGKHFTESVNILYRAAKDGVDAKVKREAVDLMIRLLEDIFSKRNVENVVNLFKLLMTLVKDQDDGSIRHLVCGELLLLRSDNHHHLQLGGQTSSFLRSYNYKQPTTFPIQELIDLFTDRIAVETDISLLTSLLNGLKGMIDNHFVVKTVNLTKLVTETIRFVEQKNQIMVNKDLTEDMKWKILTLGYDILRSAVSHVNQLSSELQAHLVYAFCNGLCIDGNSFLMASSSSLSTSGGITNNWDKPISKTRHNLYKTCLSGLSTCTAFVVNNVTVFENLNDIIRSLHNIIKAPLYTISTPNNTGGASTGMSLQTSYGKAMYIVEYLAFLVEYPNIIRNGLHVGDFKLIFEILLSYIERKLSPLQINLVYTTLVEWFLQIPTKHRPTFYDIIKPTLKKYVYITPASPHTLATEATLDTISRYAFSDCEPILYESEQESSLFFADSQNKIWLQGNTILEITTGRMGWVKVKVRRATGSVVWLMQLQNKLRSFSDPGKEMEELANVFREISESQSSSEHMEELPELSFYEDNDHSIAFDSLKSPTSYSHLESPYAYNINQNYISKQIQNVGVGALGSGNGTTTSQMRRSKYNKIYRGITSQRELDAIDNPSEDESNINSYDPMITQKYHNDDEILFGMDTFEFDTQEDIIIRSITPTRSSRGLSLSDEYTTTTSKTVATTTPFLTTPPPFQRSNSEPVENTPTDLKSDYMSNRSHTSGGDSITKRKSSSSSVVSDSDISKYTSTYTKEKTVTSPSGSLSTSLTFSKTELTKGSSRPKNRHSVEVDKKSSSSGSTSSEQTERKRASFEQMDRPSRKSSFIEHPERPSRSTKSNSDHTERKRSSMEQLERPRSSSFMEKTRRSNPESLPSNTYSTVVDPPLKTSPPRPAIPPLNLRTQSTASSSSTNNVTSPPGYERTSIVSPRTLAKTVEEKDDETEDDHVSPRLYTEPSSAPSSARLTTNQSNNNAGLNNSGFTVRRRAPSISSISPRNLPTLHQKLTSPTTTTTTTSGTNNLPSITSTPGSLATTSSNASTTSSSSSTSVFLKSKPINKRSTSSPAISLKDTDISSKHLMSGGGTGGGGGRRGSISQNPLLINLTQEDELTLIHPSFVFLQLQHIPFVEKAQLLESSDGLERALNVLDRSLTVEGYSVGVVYIGHGQTKEDQILSNTYGSPQYTEFLRGLGSMVRLSECSQDTYTAGLDRSTDCLDGQFSILWKNEVKQVMFHVATLMPNRPGDLSYTNKKQHIGNDMVNIVYNDNINTPYDPDTLKGQFNFVIIEVTPLEMGFFRVTFKRKTRVPRSFPFCDSIIVSHHSLSQIVRISSICASNAAKRLQEKDGKLDYTSNIQFRIKQLKQITERFGNKKL